MNLNSPSARIGLHAFACGVCLGGSPIALNRGDAFFAVFCAFFALANGVIWWAWLKRGGV